MPEQPSLGRLGVRRGRPELLRPADVVEQRRGAEQIAAQTRMELGELAADRRHADRVLEQAARVRVVPVDRRRELSERLPNRLVSDDRAHGRLQPGVGDLAGEEVEEALELVEHRAGRSAPARPDPSPPPARSSGRRAAACSGTARPARERGRRRLPQNVRPGGRRRARREPRCARSGPRARARGSPSPNACAAAACA